MSSTSSSNISTDSKLDSVELDQILTSITTSSSDDNSSDNTSDIGSVILVGVTKSKHKSLSISSEDVDALSTHDDDDDGVIVMTKTHPIKKFAMHAFRNPLVRIIFPLYLMFSNIILYNEDPISYSQQEAQVYGFGRIFNYVFRQYPPLDEPLWICLKVFSLLLYIVVGALLGKYFVHDALLRDCFNMGLFRKDMGSWTIMGFTAMFVVFLGSFVYNATIVNHFHVKDGSDNLPYVLSDFLGMKEIDFGVFAAIVSWLCDALMLFMVLDTMLQDAAMNKKRSIKYGCNSNTAIKMQLWWKSYRIHTFGFVFFFSVIGLFFYEGSNYEYEWITSKAGHFSWNETARCFVGATIIAADMIIFMQDWDYPRFKRGNNNIQMIGCGTAKRGCRSKKCSWRISFNGKWVNYFPWVLISMLNFNLFINQYGYVPEQYMQIADAENYVRNMYGPASNLPLTGFNGTTTLYASDIYPYYTYSNPDAPTWQFYNTSYNPHAHFIGDCNETLKLGDEKTQATNIPWCTLCSYDLSSIPPSHLLPLPVESNGSITMHDINHNVTDVPVRVIITPDLFTCYNVSLRFDIKYTGDPIIVKLTALSIAVIVACVFACTILISIYNNSRSSCIIKMKSKCNSDICSSHYIRS